MLNIPVGGEEHLEDDDQNDLFFIPKVGATSDAFRPPVAEVEKKFYALEEKVKAIQRSRAFVLNTADMYLVPRMKIHTKFKVPDIERLFMHFYQDSLSGDSLEWYM